MSTYVSDSDFRFLDSLVSGSLSLYELRHQHRFKGNASLKMQFRQLCQNLISSSKSNTDSLKLLGELLACVPTRTPCNHLCCPLCRSKKQETTAKRSARLFANSTLDDTYFITVLLPMTTHLPSASQKIDAHRKKLRSYISRYLPNTTKGSITLFGAYEYDLKSINEYLNASSRAQTLFENLGYIPCKDTPMWLPHLHAIVSSITEEQRDELRGIIQKVTYGDSQIPYGIEIKRLRTDKDIVDSIYDISTYMFKARFQHSDNIFATKDGTHKAKYKTMFPSQYVTLLSSHVKSVGSFKSLKLEIKV